MADLRLSLIGNPFVSVGGETVLIKPRKALALLAYLAVSPDPGSRDSLAELLYPRLDRDRARAGIRQCLSILRRALGREWIRADDDCLRLEAGEGLWIDVREVRTKRAARQGAEVSGNPGGVRQKLEQIERLFRGDFLAGFFLKDAAGFESWQSNQEETLRGEHAGILAELVELHLAAHEPERALGHAKRMVELDPVDEAANRALMRCCVLSGRRAEALQHYERLRNLLASEVGAPPEEETERLRERIIRGELRRAEEHVSDAGAASPSVNLRSSPTAFLGREAEVAQVVDALEQRTTRILTITGTAGTGKTRLALEAAGRAASGFPEGVFFVDLAALRKPAHVMAAIASALHLEDVKGQAASSFDVVREFLRGRRALLLLDNFEHLLDAAELVARLAAACPLLTVLTTSREALRLQAENVYLLSPMRLPRLSEPIETIVKSEAVSLFVERARASRQDFRLSSENAEAVAQICIHLDGLPLAIELAAGRTGFLPPEKLLSLLRSQGPGLLSGASKDMPSRHQTLWRALQWSFDLLNPAEKALLRRLAVFRGGFTLEAAQAVCRMSPEDDVFSCLGSLVEKNLVNRVSLGGDPRYSMLETIHEFAEERLEESGEGDAARMSHARFCLQLAEAAELEIDRSEGTRWVDRLEQEYSNLRTAFAWSLEKAVEVGLRLASALERFCDTQGHWRDEREWLESALSRSRGSVDPGLDRWRAKALAALCNTTLGPWTADASIAAGAESAALWRRIGDTRGLADALLRLGIAHTYQAVDPAVILPFLEESVSLFRENGDRMGLSHAVFWLAYFAYVQGDLVKAKANAEDARERAREAGDVVRFAGAHGLLGLFAVEEGNLSQARLLVEESLRLYRETRDTWGQFFSTSSLAGIAFLQGDYGPAHSRYSERPNEVLGTHGYAVITEKACRGFIFLREGQFDRSAESFREGIGLLRGQETSWPRQYLAACVAGIAGVADAQGRSEMAALLLEGAGQILRGAYARLAWGFDFSTTPTLFRLELERITSKVSAALGDKAERAFAAGRGYSLDELVAAALSSSDGPQSPPRQDKPSRP